MCLISSAGLLAFISDKLIRAVIGEKVKLE